MLAAGCALQLGACTTGTTRVAPIEERSPEAASTMQPAVAPRQETSPLPHTPQGTQVFALPDARVSPMTPAPAIDDAGPASKPLTDPAMRELVAQAERASARGDHGAARATLERALKIKPDDAQLWLRLAELSLFDAEYEQAIVMAQRARELARGERGVIDRSDHLIARARGELTR